MNRLLPNEQMERMQVLGTPLRVIWLKCRGTGTRVLSRCHASSSLLHRAPYVEGRLLRPDAQRQEMDERWEGRLEDLALPLWLDRKMGLR